MSAPKEYDTTIARIAGNIASGMIANWVPGNGVSDDQIATAAVDMARRIAAEVKRTEPTK